MDRGISIISSGWCAAVSILKYLLGAYIFKIKWFGTMPLRSKGFWVYNNWDGESSTVNWSCKTAGKCVKSV